MGEHKQDMWLAVANTVITSRFSKAVLLKQWYANSSLVVYQEIYKIHFFSNNTILEILTTLLKLI